MNNFNNILNKNEIENKLKDFKEGQDYSISPTDEPNLKTYNFHNDKLRSVFRGDKVPVRVTQEAYDGKDYTYRGHFEEGKDYYYGRKDWYYGENYQGDRGTEKFKDDVFKDFMNGIKWDEHSEIIGGGEAGNAFTGEKYWEARWTYRGKGSGKESLEPVEKRNSEPILIGASWENEEVVRHRNSLADFYEKRREYENKIAGLSDHIATCHPVEDEGGREHVKKLREYERDLAEFNDKIRYHEDWLAKNINGSQPQLGKDNSDLRKENQDLRQQLSEVQKQLAEVLEELKKLKREVKGEESEKLSQQIVQNERLVKESKNVSVAEIQEQVNKSQALMKEFNKVSSTKNNEEGGVLPYVIGGSVILAVAGIIGYFRLKKNKRK